MANVAYRRYFKATLCKSYPDYGNDIFSLFSLLSELGCILVKIPGYSYAVAIDPNAALNPLAKEVVTNSNPGWMNNYNTYPITKVAPVLAILGAIIAIISASKAKAGLSFTGTSLMIVGAILTAGFALFPFLLPSSINPNSSLTMWDAVSSHLTLGVMTVAAGIFVPLILIYTSWSYYKMWGVITNKHIESNSHSLY